MSCPLCHKLFSRSATYDAHLLSTHKLKADDERLQKPVVVCGVCEVQLNPAELDGHMLKHPVCSVCDLQCKNAYALTTHTRTEHRTPNKKAHKEKPKAAPFSSPKSKTPKERRQQVETVSDEELPCQKNIEKKLNINDLNDDFDLDLDFISKSPRQEKSNESKREEKKSSKKMT